MSGKELKIQLVYEFPHYISTGDTSDSLEITFKDMTYFQSKSDRSKFIK